MAVEPLGFRTLLKPALLALNLVEQPRPVIEPQPAALGQAQHRRLENRRCGVLEARTVEAKAVGTGAIAQGALGSHVDMPGFPARPQRPRELSQTDVAFIVNDRLMQ